jgi:hypothetical protein
MGDVDVLSALIPPVALLALFIVLAVTAYRATDGARRGRNDSPDENESDPAER